MLKTARNNMTGMTIRQYRPSDFERCRALWVELTECHREIYGDPSIGGDNPGLYFDKHLERVGAPRIWVAECAGEILGLTGLVLDDQEGEIEPVIVKSGHRGKGIGQALVNRVIEEARKLGVRYLSVKPVARNGEAISFFYASGFQILGHIEMFMDLSQQGKWKAGPELAGCTFEY